MKKYTPSIKTNNKLKDTVVSEIRSMLYKLEHGGIQSDIDPKTIASVIEDLKADIDLLDGTVGTGEEKVDEIAEKILELVKDFKKQMNHMMEHRFVEAANQLDFYINMWKDSLDGEVSLSMDEDEAKAKASFARRKLTKRLTELEEVKETFIEHSRRLEREIVGFEKDMAELDAAILVEDNERKINDLFRQVTALKSKGETLNARKSNYEACYNLLDIIYVNAKEIVEASDLASEEMGKAKVFLNIAKLKKVIAEPDKALRILKQMQDDIKKISDRTKVIDEKIGVTSSVGTSISGDALAYKEELLKKKREKERLAENAKSIDDGKLTANADTDTTTEEEV